MASRTLPHIGGCYWLNGLTLFPCSLGRTAHAIFPCPWYPTATFETTNPSKTTSLPDSPHPHITMHSALEAPGTKRSSPNRKGRPETGTGTRFRARQRNTGVWQGSKDDQRHRPGKYPVCGAWECASSGALIRTYQLIFLEARSLPWRWLH